MAFERNHRWDTGNPLTAERMNNIQEGIEEALDNASSAAGNASTALGKANTAITEAGQAKTDATNAL